MPAEKVTKKNKKKKKLYNPVSHTFGRDYEVISTNEGYVLILKTNKKWKLKHKIFGKV